jgi:cysteine sulfinate desulfinase/cysteine desulfurase-like protein
MSGKSKSSSKSKTGLWDRIRNKQARIKAGSKEKMRKPGSKGAPTAAAFKAAAKTAKKPAKKKAKK